jgi:hypothetical protein
MLVCMRSELMMMNMIYIHHMEEEGKNMHLMIRLFREAVTLTFLFNLKVEYYNKIRHILDCTILLF